MTNAPAITMALADTARHPDVAALAHVDGVALVAAPIRPASFVLVCADGAALAVRYMSPTDLLHSIRTRALEADLIQLKARSEWAYLLIGGQMTPNLNGRCAWGGDATGWGWDAYQGALLSAQEAGVGVLTLRHADDAGEALARLARRPRAPKRVRPVREALFVDPAQDLLMALPGVGDTLADALLAHCGSARAALLALTSDEVSAPGVGPKTRAAARRVLGGVTGPI